MERSFKGIWIPREIWLSKELTLQEKVFLAEIDSLDNDNGCYASNKYFSEFFGLTPSRCSQIINNLQDKGFVKMTYIYGDRKEIKKRVIKVVNKFNTPIKYPKAPIKYPKGGYLENAKENNTCINNTNNISSSSAREEIVFDRDVKENPFLLFENEGFGTISPIIADKLNYLIDDYGEEWTMKAMGTAVLAGSRRINYVEGILKRWKESGDTEPWRERSNVRPFPINKKENKSGIDIQSEIDKVFAESGWVE